MKGDTIDFLQRRERMERAAAKTASCAAARRVHQELAQRYHARISGAAVSHDSAEDSSNPGPIAFEPRTTLRLNF